jgi:glyoxylase-like metal-dependent hydrolase (beta-lactamase superfamily II)
MSLSMRSRTPVSSSGRPVLIRHVAPGIHRLAHAYVNCYLVEDGRDVTIVDTAFPSTWRHLLSALRECGHSPGDVNAVVLTHGHFDHLGCAARAASEFAVPVWVHERDSFIAAHPYRYQHERPRALYPLCYPRGMRVLAAMTAAGALRVTGVREVRRMPASAVLDVPGRPTVVFSPGHTYGHCALFFPERDAIITGDALVTLDPYTAQTGARIIAGAATADSEMALASLRALAATQARIVLPGHGEPWRAGIGAAVAAALAVGAS